MVKTKVLVIGGDADRNISKKVRELIDFDLIPSGKDVLPHKANGKQIIILLTRWVSPTQSKRARDLATKLKLPLGFAVTGNHIPEVLAKYGLLPKEKEPVPQAVATATPVKRHEAVTTDPDSMSTDDLWKIYGAPTISFIEGLMSPGEKQDEATLLSLMTDSGGLALSKAACKRLLDELHTRWRLINTVGTTWKLLGAEQEYEEDLEPATIPEPSEPKPKKVKTEGRKLRERGSKLFVVEKLGGLPPGPYKPKKKLHPVMMKYKEFRKMDGSEPSIAYSRVLWDAGVKLGILVETEDNGLRVVPNPAIKLTPIDGAATVAEPKKPQPVSISKAVVPPSAPKPAPEPEATPGIDYEAKAAYVSLSEFTKAPTVDTPDRTASLVREAYGGEIPWHGDHTPTVRKLRGLLPIECWDEMAARTVAKKLFPKESRSWRDFLVVSKQLEVKEWDFLAWESLKEMPLNVIAPWLRDQPKDIPCHCRECGKDFMFTVAEQDYLERQFGQVIPPKSCQPCRAARRR